VAANVHLIRKYLKTKQKSSLYLSIACFVWAVAAVFAAANGAPVVVNDPSLATFFYRVSATSGTLGFLFANMFAVAVMRPKEKQNALWIPFGAFLIVAFIIWGFPVSFEGIGGTTEFTLTSTYKEPFGPPFTEIMIMLLALMAFYPASFFFGAARYAKERTTRLKSLLIGLGIVVGTASYATEVTNAISYQYLFLCRIMILVGSATVLLSELIYRDAPAMPTRLHAFSKSLGLNHKQIAGRKILLEFDPASNYEQSIRDFVAEALAGSEEIVIFTRKSSTLHSSLQACRSVKFFSLTQQSSVPKELSENEVLLPSGDTSLMVGVMDKTLKAYPNAAINVVFDNLSDLVLSIGFEKTYKFIAYALEILASPRSTVIFLLNRTAHDAKVTSSLRSLFNNQMFFGEDGMQAVKLSEVEIAETV
jgi:hypothetical protein